MSRRKQSNPKPFKRLSDDEDEDADPMKLSESQKPEVETTTSDKPEIHSVSSIKSEPVSPLASVDDEKKNFADCKSPVIFLNDVLLLKKVEKDEANQTGRSFIVCAAIPLPKGSSIGPFDAEIVSLSSIRQGDMVLQAQDENGETSFVRVEDPSATWLTMLRPAPSDSVRNTSVLYKGGQIWCEIISELQLGTELLSSFTIQEADISAPCSPDSSDVKEKEDEITMEIKTEVRSPPSLQPTSPVANNNVINHAALLYGCPFCGVRFSSARTLEGHLTYYCSKKPSSVNAQEETSEQNNEETDETEEREKMSPKEEKSDENEKEKQNTESSGDMVETDSSNSKLLKAGELFHCPYCSYTSDKLSSLNRHKRIHGRGSNSPTSSTSSESPAPKQDSYCAECNIQFSSFSTYKCHKEYYCSKRLESSNLGVPPAEKKLIPTVKDFSTLPFHEQLSPSSAKNLKQLITVSSGALISGQTNVILAPPIIARGMLNLPFGMPTVIVQPVVPHSSVAVSPPIIQKSKSKEPVEIACDQPLDLSVSKKITNSDDSDKENSLSPKHYTPDEKRRGSIKAERTSKSTSPVLTSPIRSPRQRNRSASTSNEEKTPSPLPSTSNRISPYISVPPVQFIGGKPIPPVPHSVSKCVDCNIVFYKHENYIIHKKHYCSSRQTPSDSGEVFDEQSKDSEEMAKHHSSKKLREEETDKSTDDMPLDVRKHETDVDSSKDGSKDTKKSPEVDQKGDKQEDLEDAAALSDHIVCKPCNIRFSSLSTLSAHKEFYCPYVRELNARIHSNEQHDDQDLGKSKCQEDGIAKCDRCNASFPSMKILRLHFCTGMTTQVPLLRCPYCDYVTQTENRISEHLKVHMPSKAYRCTLCGYRGNTVRGMRMHGKMHIDNGEEFSDENMVEIEEPPLLPVIFNNPNEPTSTNVEAELIRLKNEPYKRRRSRKSYEKSEHMGNIREPSQKSVCVYCGQPFNDSSTLAMHMRIHEMVAFHAASSRNLKCHFCDHVAETFPSLMVHVENKHLKDVCISKKEDQDSRSSNSESPTRSSLDSDLETSTPAKRSRRESESPETEPVTGLNSKTPHSDLSMKKRLQIDHERERTLEMLNLSVKIKSEPIDREYKEDASVSKENVNNNEIPRKRKHSSPDPPRKRSESSSPPNKKLHDHAVIKYEKSNGSDEHSPPLRSPVLTPELARYYQLAMQVMPPLIVPRVPNRPLPSSPEHTEKMPSSAKYCKYCDISFTYLSTYVAHKKYYCTTRQEDVSTPC